MPLPTRSRAIFGLAGGVLCASASYAAAGDSASPVPSAWLQVAAITLLVHAMLDLGSSGRSAHWGRSITACCLSGGFAAALLIPADVRRVLGVPMGTVLMFTLVGFVPLVVLPVCFALNMQAGDRVQPFAGFACNEQMPTSTVEPASPGQGARSQPAK